MSDKLESKKKKKDTYSNKYLHVYCTSLIHHLVITVNLKKGYSESIIITVF